jgi:large subunit ribosomal protein L31
MKEDIHPQYRSVVFHDLSSDFKVLTRSTASSEEKIKWEDGNEYPVIKFDLSSASHAFYTGKDQQLNDKGGRIEQFRLRYGKQESAASETAEEAAEPADS